MGMPISTYTVLDALANSDAHSHEGRLARKTLAAFRLFAFIVHDPEAHSDFDQHLSNSFDEFDYLTGSNLLFFALVDPPRDWLRHAAGRGYYQEIKSWETKQVLSPNHAIVSTDSGLTAFALANSLNIPNDMLPCLIVTDDFQADQFLWVKTCKEHIGRQLQTLGYIAERSRRPIRFDSKDLDLCDGWGIESLGESLAEALSDLLSFIVAGRASSPYEKSRAREQASRTLKRLFAALQAMKTKEPDQETLERLCMTISMFLAQLNEQSALSSVNVKITPTSLEQESYQILRTAYKVLDMLIGANDRTTESILGTTYDFTPAVICLAKVFEREANLSLVHWVRKELGVSLPTYFNKPQPGIVAKLRPDIPNARRIDFNANRSGQWLAPGMGQSELGCLELAKTRLPVGWDNTSWDLLLSHWKVIRQRRNEAAHVHLVTEGPAFEVKAAIEALAASRIFDRMCEMKTEYRGGDPSTHDDLAEPRQQTLVLGFNFNAEVRHAEGYFSQGLIGECLKAIGKIRQYTSNVEEDSRVRQLADKANAIRDIRLSQVERFASLLDRLDQFLKDHCPLCGKELAGATRCWDKSCEPLWDTVKNLGLFKCQDEAIMNLSDSAFKKLMTLLAGLKVHGHSNQT